MEKHGNKWLAITAGILFAVALQFALAWYQTGRAYGNQQNPYAMSPTETQDYQIQDEKWTVSGSEPMILFQTSQDIGHIHISLKEALEQNTIVVLYFTEDSDFQFDRFHRTERYMMAGSREADLTVPVGAWRTFRLEIRGSFVLNELTLTPALDPSAIPFSQILRQINIPQMLILCFLSPCGMYLWFGRFKAGKASSSYGKNRMIWLDMLRSLAAAFVIIVHVVEPMLPFLVPSGSYLHLLAQGITIITLTSNLLFVFISGMLLLPYREEPIRVFVRRRVLSVVLPLLVYSIFYIRLTCISHVSEGVWLSYYLRTLISGSIPEAPHLWLVYQLIALYLVAIPFRYLLKEIPERLEKQLTLLILILLGLRTASVYFCQPIGISCFLDDWPGIFLLGYLFTRSWMRKYDLFLIAGGIAAFAISLWLSGFRTDYKLMVCNQSILMAFMAMAVSAVILHMEPWLKPFRRILSVCSRYSYSVLLIHWYILNQFVYIGWMPPTPSFTAQIILPFLICLIGSLIFSILIDHLILDVLEYALNRVL